MLSLSATSYQGAQPPPRYNLARAALAHTKKAPDKTALCIWSPEHGSQPYVRATYAELSAHAAAIAHAINSHDLPPQSRIAIRMQTGHAYAASLLAITGCGHVAAPLSPQLTKDELDGIVVRARIVAIAHDGGMEPTGGVAGIDVSTVTDEMHTDDDTWIIDTHADDPAILVFTSGTGATPKGVLHAHRTLFGRRPLYDGWYGASPDDIFFHTGAMNWTYGFGSGLLDPLVLGTTANFIGGPCDAGHIAELIKASDATVLATVPGIHRQLVRLPGVADKLRTLRVALTAGETLRPELAQQWTAVSSAPLAEAFGMSEISTYISTVPGMAPRDGSPGKPQRGRAVAVLSSDRSSNDPVGIGDIGELAVHASDPAMMLGYLAGNGDVALLPRDSWFRTGDLARMDQDGYIHPQGRADDVINAMGYRVSPGEVEAALTACPGVSDAAAIGLSPKAGVSIVTAFVVASDAVIEAGADALMKQVSTRLAAYKCPKDIRFVDALPRTPNGKVKRSDLREDVADPQSDR